MKKIIAILAVGVGIGSGTVYAADGPTATHTVTVTIPEVALLDLESSGSPNFTLAYTAPTEAGLGLGVPSASSTIWLNYSSIIANSGETSRTVSAQITSGTVPAGAQLTTVVSPDFGEGAGNMGVRVPGTIALTGSVTSLINNIGSCYTGTGISKGHSLTFTLAVAPGNYALLTHGSTNVTVTYTLSDN